MPVSLLVLLLGGLAARGNCKNRWFGPSKDLPAWVTNPVIAKDGCFDGQYRADGFWCKACVTMWLLEAGLPIFSFPLHTASWPVGLAPADAACFPHGVIEGRPARTSIHFSAQPGMALISERRTRRSMP